MKKILFFAIALFTMTAQAQIAEEINKSRERVEKLKTLCEEYVKIKKTEEPNIDEASNAVYLAAVAAMENSEKLENFYKREIGETEGGITDLEDKKPTLEEWIELGTGITAEGVLLKTAIDKINQATEDVKKMSEEVSAEKNPMKAAKKAKKVKAVSDVMTFCKSATSIIAEESAAQAKAIQEIISTLKSKNNL